MFCDLFAEFFSGHERTEGVMVGFREKLNMSGPIESLEGREDIRSVFPALINECSGEREGDGETRIGMEQFFEERVCRKVALLRDFAEHGPVFFVIEVIR